MSQPERKAGQFITMDAAMLAQQNERLASLDENIQKLATAISQRPTKMDVDQVRKRLRNQLAATVLVGLALFGYVFHQQKEITEGCIDRNENTEKFRVLVAVIVNESSQRPESAVSNALESYLTTLKPVKC